MNINKDTKIIISAVVILLFCCVVFTSAGDISDITGQSFLSKFKFWGRRTIKTVPAPAIREVGIRTERKGYEPPITKKCVDSDGLNLGVKGTCTEPNGDKKEDLCDSTSVVIEQFCDDSNNCLVRKYDCPSSYECKDGACVKGERYEPGRKECTETDGGVNYYEKGTIRYFYDVPTDPFYGWHETVDVCDGNYLAEFSCDYYNPKELHPYKRYLCPNGCENGVCNPSGDYVTMTIEYRDHVDLAQSNYPGVGTSEKTIQISSIGDDIFNFVSNPTIKTNRVWITQDYNNFLVFYRDLNKIPTMQYFGNVSYPSRYLLEIKRSGDIIAVEPGGGSEALTNVVFLFDGSDERYIQANFKSNNWEINSLGNIQSLAEMRELGLQEDFHEYIGEYNDDYITKDGTIIKNPNLNGGSDQVVLDVPI